MDARLQKMIEKEVKIAMAIPEVRELINKMSTKEAKADLLARIIIAIA